MPFSAHPRRNCQGGGEAQGAQLGGSGCRSWPAGNGAAADNGKGKGESKGGGRGRKGKGKGNERPPGVCWVCEKPKDQHPDGKFCKRPDKPNAAPKAGAAGGIAQASRGAVNGGRAEGAFPISEGVVPLGNSEAAYAMPAPTDGSSADLLWYLARNKQTEKIFSDMGEGRSNLEKLMTVL